MFPEFLSQFHSIYCILIFADDILLLPQFLQSHCFVKQFNIQLMLPQYLKHNTKLWLEHLFQKKFSVSILITILYANPSGFVFFSGSE